MNEQRRRTPTRGPRTVVVGTRAFSYGIALGFASLLFGHSSVLAGSTPDLSIADRSCTSVICPPSGGPELAAAIAHQTAAGRTCTTQPSMTDDILFQWKDGDAVQVLSFDETVRATAGGLGWVQRYCS